MHVKYIDERNSVDYSQAVVHGTCNSIKCDTAIWGDGSDSVGGGGGKKNLNQTTHILVLVNILFTGIYRKWN